jgi:hypothetical protein
MRWRSLLIDAILLALGGCWLMVTAIDAAEPAPGRPVGFVEDVLPLLRRRCVECHGAAKAEGGLRLDERAAALAESSSDRTIMPGDSAASELIRRVSLPRTDDDAMPPLGQGLSPREIAILRQWIDAGAAWPERLPEQKHWAYVPPVAAAVPPGVPAIDALVAAAHEREGLRFAPEADRALLARRLSLDLVGLPPSPAAVDAFVDDTAAGAHERFVDRLLDSDEFGVRWARMWLDLARYADSHGYQRDDLRDIWAYRDWVVDALNADMPFDRFTIEQIAGDLLPTADERTRIATGFHRCTPTNVEAGTDPEESRINQVLDRVNTTGAVWLGTTLECAQCHDHKYDPFTQADYYRLAAYFNSTEAEAERANPRVPGSIRFRGPSMLLPKDPLAKERASVQRRLAEARQRLERLRSAETQAVAGTPTSAPSGGEESPAAGQAAGASTGRRSKLDEDEPAAARMAREVKQIEAELATMPSATTLVMRELQAARATFIFNRGVFSDQGAAVTPGTPSILGVSLQGPANRLALARWLVDREHPLTARVMVNRIWHELFGRGLVATVEDFGIKGEPPSHPELLDHLAVEFMEDGWSLKRLIRRIVMSRTYRQDSRLAEPLAAFDPDNRWLARGPRFRLDAEAIRDNALAIAGLLSSVKGGPPIRPPQPDGLWRKVGGQQYDYEASVGEQRYRRGLYVVLKRGSPYPSFTAFDATARMTCVVRRSRSNTPLQALVLLNDPVYTEAAIALARRLLLERPGVDDRRRVEHAFRLAVARLPRSGEVDALCRLLDRERRSAQTDPGAVAQLVAAHPLIEPPEAVPAGEIAAWYAVATTVLNLAETITRE